MMNNLNSHFQNIQSLFEMGGVLMWPLTLLAMFIYYEALRLWMRVSLHPLCKKIKLNKPLMGQQSRWLHTCESNGKVVGAARQRNITHLREDVIAFYRRRSSMLGHFVKSAPLLGLLGTVMGMLSTFEGMLGSGSERAGDMALGISQALITTQYGLLIVIPGIMILAMIQSSIKKLERNLLSLEIKITEERVRSSQSTSLSLAS